MSATSMAPLIYGGIPVFADIEDETYCLNKKKVESLITEKTKAIIAVNLFGHPAELKDLRRLADENNIFLIEDNAQSPLAKEFDCYTGTIGHIGVFSLNYHKHVHTGEVECGTIIISKKIANDWNQCRSNRWTGKC